MRIRAPLYFERFFNRLRWTVWSPAGRGMRQVARVEWGQYSSNRGGHRLRYWVRSLHFLHWRKRRA